MAKEEKEKKVKETKKVEVKEEHECACGKDCKCKKGRVGRVFFVIGLVVVLCAVFFAVGMVSGAKFIYDEDMVEEVDKEDKEDNKDENNTHNNTQNYWVDYSEIEKAIDNYSYLTAVDKGFNNISEIDVNMLVRFAAFKIENRESTEYFTLDEINVVLKKYFDYTLETGMDIKCDVCDNTLWFYDAETKRFTFKDDNSHGHEGSGYGELNRIVSVTNVDENKYVVLVKKAFGISPYVITNYYTSLEEKKNESEPVFSLEGDPAFTEAEFNNIPNDKLNTYEYVFEKVDNRLVLKSFRKF